jgi:hypothetical protein
MGGNKSINERNGREKELQEIFKMPNVGDFAWRGSILEFDKHMNDEFRVPFYNELSEMKGMGNTKYLD